MNAKVVGTEEMSKNEEVSLLHLEHLFQRGQAHIAGNGFYSTEWKLQSADYGGFKGSGVLPYSPR